MVDERHCQDTAPRCTAVLYIIGKRIIHGASYTGSTSLARPRLRRLPLLHAGAVKFLLRWCHPALHDRLSEACSACKCAEMPAAAQLYLYPILWAVPKSIVSAQRS